MSSMHFSYTHVMFLPRGIPDVNTTDAINEVSRSPGSEKTLVFPIIPEIHTESLLLGFFCNSCSLTRDSVKGSKIASSSTKSQNNPSKNIPKFTKSDLAIFLFKSLHVDQLKFTYVPSSPDKAEYHHSIIHQCLAFCFVL